MNGNYGNKSQLKRLNYIKEKLREGRYPSCGALACEYEVSSKTISRDIDFLKYQLNAPIEYDAVKKGYYLTEPMWDLPSVNLSEGDAFAICIAEKALEQYRDTPLYPKLKAVFDRIAASMPNGAVILHPAWVSQRILFMPHPPRRIDHKVWSALAKAVSTNTTVAITYKTPLKPKTVRKVNPYRLINYHGEWYLIGLCHTKKEIRNFAVSRITTAENLKATFTLPSEDELTNACDVQFGIMQGNKTYDVGVQFTPEAAPYAIERQWHPRQKITQNPDGTVTIHFPATHLAEVKAWILSWGRTARTTQPPELVDLLKQELAAAAANYQ